MRLRLTQTALLLALCLITACSPPMMGARRADAPIASTTRFEAALVNGIGEIKVLKDLFAFHS